MLSLAVRKNKDVLYVHKDVCYGIKSMTVTLDT